MCKATAVMMYRFNKLKAVVIWLIDLQVCLCMCASVYVCVRLSMYVCVCVARWTDRHGGRRWSCSGCYWKHHWSGSCSQQKVNNHQLRATVTTSYWSQIHLGEGGTAVCRVRPIPCRHLIPDTISRSYTDTDTRKWCHPQRGLYVHYICCA